MADPTDDTVPAELDRLATADGPLDTMERLLAQVAHAPAATPPLAEGERLGRYLLVQRLGAGGMGVVFAAYDPQLDRKVAVKVLRRDLAGSAVSERARDRTLREARALARLVHPNIVAVHDAGYHARELYIVMELVNGQSLRGWLKEAPRTPTEIARVFRQAAEGLIAAHAAGMVHRDFKPDNVLVGTDGRVRVADFGLVQIAGGSTDGSQHRDGGAADLTVTGAFMGTPGYMAPEQIDDADVDARADQYAFGVSLWQALYGELPFDQTNLAQRRKAQGAGPPAEPAGKRAPGWLRRIVRRTMAAAPADRFPDVAAVAAAIDRGLGRRRRIATVAVGIGVAGALATAIAVGASGRPPGDRCAAGAAAINQAWNPERATAIARRMPAGAAGADAAAKLRTRLDEYARRWSLAHRAACRATTAGEQSKPMLDVRMACLRRARYGLETLVTMAASGELPAGSAQTAAERLPSLDQCDESVRTALSAPWPDDPALGARLEDIQRRVSRAQLDLNLVVDAAALARSQEALAMARQAGWTPLIAEAALSHGALQLASEQPAAALASDREAVVAALAGGEDRITMRAMVDAAVALAELGRDGEAGDMLDLARAIGRRLDNTPFVRAELEGGAWEIERRAQRYDRALVAAEAAADAARAAGDPIEEASRIGNLAIALYEAGRRDEAVRIGQQVVERAEQLRGREHPDVASTLGNQATILANVGRADEALALAQRALAITERWYGQDARMTVDALLAVSGTLGRTGRIEEGITVTERALAILASHGEDDTHDYATHLANLAMARAQLGQLDEAYAGGQRALAVFEQVHGPRSPLLGNTLVLLGWVERARGEFDASAATLGRAVRDAEAGLGPEHPELINLRNELAHTERARRRFAAAIALYERSLTRADDKDVNPMWIAEAELGLAAALWDGGGDRARARAAAVAARDRYAALGDDFAGQRDEAVAWLAAHGGAP